MVAMSGLMLAGKRLGLTGELPPETITRKALAASDAGDEVTASQRDVLASLMHLGFGVGTGALFAVVQPRLPDRLSPVVSGVAFGSLVWAVSYAGWVPALGILPPPQRDRPGRQWVMLGAHWVYGGVLGATTAQLGRRLGR